mmetsp:Transcript_73861/g.149944  ORF Transcript_73861/g.149944 Transcript_73861/m.149944 type:complete len:209 (-) Transcript_73861:325-951(-)
MSGWSASDSGWKSMQRTTALLGSVRLASGQRTMFKILGGSRFREPASTDFDVEKTARAASSLSSSLSSSLPILFLLLFVAQSVRAVDEEEASYRCLNRCSSSWLLRASFSSRVRRSFFNRELPSINEVLASSGSTHAGAISSFPPSSSSSSSSSSGSSAALTKPVPFLQGFAGGPLSASLASIWTFLFTPSSSSSSSSSSSGRSLALT